jgi:selenide,water dikinase
VFAAGDAAVMAGDPRPKAGVFAVRQGPVLAANLRRALDGRRPRRFRPQRRFLGLISTGPRHAIASWGPLAVCGGWVWRWKDWIDRRFMARYNELPAMASPAPALAPLIRAAAAAEPQLAAADMRCAGCGGKVGAAMLGEALRRLAPIARADVLVGLAEAGDAAIVRVPPGKVLVQSVDHFRAPIDDPYRFGRIAATHALSDLYAMGAEPQSALAIVTLPFGPAALRRDTLDQLMAGAVAALNEAGASLIGGHTGEGDLALGFAVSGLADASAATAKPRLRPGDRLVLTKRVGTGTLLAAHMRGRAKARWIEGAVGAMLTSNREAAAVLSAHGARAVTDVTGFGLAGHLLALLRGTGRHARLDLAAVPVLDGAIETARRGDLSSLHPENAEAAAAIANAEAFAADPRYALLFDPQTSGGLLAAVAPGRAEACLAALAALGPAAIIGEVERAAGGAPIRLA